DDDNDGGGPNEDDDALKKGATLFIRNLSFNTEEETLYEKFREFGKLRYCRIVVDNQTGQSRGTAFVSFWDPTDAKACLEAAETAKKVADIVDVTTASTKPVNVAGSRSVLLPEAPASLDATTRFTLDGRLLVVSRAVDRNKAAELAKENIKKRQKDKRNLYLLREGVVFPNTPAAKLMTPAEVNRHLTEYNSQKALLTKNPNLFISKTRLSIHNLPLSVDAKALREAGKTALAAFKREVNNKSRQPLSVEELAQGWNLKPRIVQSKIVHSKDRIDTKTNKPRSKGFGFIEFSTHVHALACLRYMNLKSPKEIFGKYA
ncbi:RNA recognition motif-containing protein, partial [Spiromyces aspiralis]